MDNRICLLSDSLAALEISSDDISPTPLKKYLEENFGQSKIYSQLIAATSKQLCHFVDGLTPPSIDDSGLIDDTAVVLKQIHELLQATGCIYKSLYQTDLSSVALRLLLLEYLVGELQSARMLAVKHDKETSTSAEHQQNGHSDTSISASTLLKQMLKALGFSRPPDNIDATLLFDRTCEKIKTQLDKCSTNYRNILKRPVLEGGALTDKQWHLIKQLNDEFSIEYRMRASLLLKRLDVTIESFAWSDRVKKIEEKMIGAYRPMRARINTQSHITISDILAARIDLCFLERTSTGSARQLSKLNHIIMKGQMPDRGGRPDQIQAPPPEMPSWQKNRAPPQQRNKSPRGGGRGGDWRGRGGHDDKYGGSRGGGRPGAYHHQQEQQYYNEDPYAHYQRTQFGNPAFASHASYVQDQYQYQRQNEPDFYEKFNNYQQQQRGRASGWRGGRARGRGY